MLPAQGQAEDYPRRQITIVVPAAAGGGLDRVARLVADKLREKWGQPVIVENRGGAGGIIGTDYVAKRQSRRLHAGDSPAPANSSSSGA